MASAQRSDSDEWRLGIELGEHHELELVHPPSEPQRDLSLERLERPLEVVTVERLGWALAALYAILTRFAFLAARPLDASEAQQALFQYGLAANGFHTSAITDTAYGGWVHMLQAGFFSAFGANDFTARVVFALSGVLLVAIAFETRHYVGRAGALALAALLVTSPTVTYFSRKNTTVPPTAALALVAVVIFMALKRNPGQRKAIALGCVAGLMIAADSIGTIAAVSFLTGLVLIGLWELAAGKNNILRMRVWLDRYSSLVAAVIVAAVVVWFISLLMLPGAFSEAAIDDFGKSIWPVSLASSFAQGFRVYGPVFAFYEFLIALMGAFGLAIIVSLRVRSRFALWCAIWMVLSLGFFLWMPAWSGDRMLAMLLPAAVVGAFGVDYLHHTGAWRIIRYPLAALAALTLYVQVLTNFVYAAPDASEASWARHASLFWFDGATTIQTRDESARALEGITPADATAFFNDNDGDSDANLSALEWYLRALRPVDKPEAATVVVEPKPDSMSRDPDSGVRTFSFDVDESWSATSKGFNLPRALAYFFAARAWGPVETHASTIIVKPGPAVAPTQIITPGASP
jgi:predicted membrane-bound mannosyltransferase